MEIFLSVKATSMVFQFPVLPEKIDCSTAANFIEYDIIGVGKVKIPLGEDLTDFKWEGMLPGLSRSHEYWGKKSPVLREVRPLIQSEMGNEIPEGAPSWIKYPVDPLAVQRQWSVWKAQGTLLHLLITGTTINHDVYLENYDMEVSGAFGDQHYKISFIHAKPLQVLTEAEINGTSGLPEAQEAEVETRPAIHPKTYTVVRGDSLWKIAQKFYGAGSRWGEIYEANKGTVGNNPNLIYPGQTLTIP